MFVLEITLTILVLYLVLQICICAMQLGIHSQFNREVTAVEKNTIKLRLSFLFPAMYFINLYKTAPIRSERNQGWEKGRTLKHDFWFGVITCILYLTVIAISLVIHFVFSASVLDGIGDTVNSSHRTLALVAGIIFSSPVGYAACIGMRRLWWDKSHLDDN